MRLEELGQLREVHASWSLPWLAKKCKKSVKQGKMALTGLHNKSRVCAPAVEKPTGKAQWSGWGELGRGRGEPVISVIHLCVISAHPLKNVYKAPCL